MIRQQDAKTFDSRQRHMTELTTRAVETAGNEPGGGELSLEHDEYEWRDASSVNATDAASAHLPKILAGRFLGAPARRPPIQAPIRHPIMLVFGLGLRVYRRT